MSRSSENFHPEHFKVEFQTNIFKQIFSQICLRYLMEQMHANTLLPHGMLPAKASFHLGCSLQRSTRWIICHHLPLFLASYSFISTVSTLSMDVIWTLLLLLPSALVGRRSGYIGHCLSNIFMCVQYIHDFSIAFVHHFIFKLLNISYSSDLLISRMPESKISLSEIFCCQVVNSGRLINFIHFYKQTGGIVCLLPT